MEYPNFYENLDEALRRLHSTFVVYDGEPYYIQAITNHRDDGIFRVYMTPIVNGNYIPIMDNYNRADAALGLALDKWMDEGGPANEGVTLVRKRINSPKFNKFRPFKMGMCNFGGRVYYLERIPNRKMEQGMISSMVVETAVTANPRNAPNSGYGGPRNVDLWSQWFRNCVKGEYPDIDLCLESLLDRDVTNEAAAFSREFALVRGPLGTLFLAYKQDIIGTLPAADLGNVVLGRDWGWTKEAVEDLGVFGNVTAVTN